MRLWRGERLRGSKSASRRGVVGSIDNRPQLAKLPHRGFSLLFGLVGFGYGQDLVGVDIE